MLDFRYAKNIRKLLQIEKAQEKMKDFDLVMEMMMEDSYKQKLAELDVSKGPMLVHDRLIEYIVMDHCEDSQVVEFMGLKDKGQMGYLDVKYRYVYKPNKGIMSCKCNMKCVEELADLEEGRTLIMSDGHFTPWKLEYLFDCDWNSTELKALASLGYDIVGITYEYNIIGIRGKLHEDTCVMLRVEKTKTTEK